MTSKNIRQHFFVKYVKTKLIFGPNGRKIHKIYHRDNRAEVEHINRAIFLDDWDNMFLPLDINEQAKLLNETLLNIFNNFIPP